MKTFVSAKIHGVRVTDKSVQYNGSVSICPQLMEEVGIEEFEKVQIVNLTNGNRWETYAIKARNHKFTLNGGGARLGEIGDECVIITYRTEHEFSGANVIFVGEDNFIRGATRYENP
jgi:aspartate 1-decarboxylase